LENCAFHWFVLSKRAGYLGAPLFEPRISLDKGW